MERIRWWFPLLVCLLTPPAMLAQAPAGQTDADRAVLERAAAVGREVAAHGRIRPEVARQVVEELTRLAPDPAALPEPTRRVYWRTLALARPVTGDLAGAADAVAQWRQLAPDDRMAERAALYLAFLAGDGEQARSAIERLRTPRNQDWQTWLAYVERFLPLLGAPAEVALPLSDAGQARPGGGQTVLVLDIWSAGAGGEANLQRQAGWMEAYAGRPVRVAGVNLDLPDAAPQARALLAAAQASPPQFLQAEHKDVQAAAALAVTSVPTVMVFGADGRLLFAGTPGTWEPHTAIEYGLRRLEAASQPAVATPAGRAAPTAADEEAAQALYDEGIRLLRLGRRGASATFRAQGEAMLRECIEKYPDTQAAFQARLEFD